MKKVVVLMALLNGLILISCNSNNNNNGVTDCAISRIVDSANSVDFQVFEYNDAQKITKYLSNLNGGSGNNGWVDTFIYIGNALAKTHYNLGHEIKPTPYAKTEYEFSGAAAVKSKYYIGNTNLISECEYQYDTQNRLIRVKQTSFNTASGAQSHTTRYEYDANSNLTKIYFQQGSFPEYICKEYLDYDDKPNPFYGMSPDFDLDIYLYSDHKLSKNNPRRLKYYTSFSGNPPVLSSDLQVRYTYDNDNKITKRSYFNNISSRTEWAQFFQYECQ